MSLLEEFGEKVSPTRSILMRHPFKDTALKMSLARTSVLLTKPHKGTVDVAVEPLANPVSLKEAAN